MRTRRPSTTNSDFAELHQDDDIARANSTGYYNRPVVVEEFGKGYSAHGSNMGSVWSAVTAFYNKHYNPADSLNVDAIVQWGVSAYDQSYDDGNASTEHAPRYQQIVSGDSGVMRRYMWHWLTWAGELDRLNGGGTEPAKLVQSVWRGDVEYQRRVPIDAYGSPNFGPAQGWVAVRKHYDMPGAGLVQAYNVTLYPNRVLQESLWRGDMGYYRDIPLNPGGMPNWKAAGGWGSVAPWVRPTKRAMSAVEKASTQKPSSGARASSASSVSWKRCQQASGPARQMSRATSERTMRLRDQRGHAREGGIAETDPIALIVELETLDAQEEQRLRVAGALEALTTVGTAGA